MFNIFKKQSMPNELILIRHGESEANIIQRSRKKGLSKNIPEKYFSTPDREIRLSKLGIEQAKETGLFLKEMFKNGVDVIYVSDHTRAKETCALVCLAAGWNHVKIKVDPQLGERNWGGFHLLDDSKRKEILENKKRDPLHTAMPDGETLLEARNRTRTFLERCYRQYSGKKVLVFTHGEYIESIWAEIAHMRTEEQISFFKDSVDIKNCQVIRFLSEKGKLSKFNSSNPYLKEFGRWTKIDKKTFSPKELYDEVLTYPKLF